MGLFYPFQSNNPLSTRPCSSIVARSLHTRWVAPRISTGESPISWNEFDIAEKCVFREVGTEETPAISVALQHPVAGVFKFFLNFGFLLSKCTEEERHNWLRICFWFIFWGLDCERKCVQTRVLLMTQMLSEFVEWIICWSMLFWWNLYFFVVELSSIICTHAVCINAQNLLWALEICLRYLLAKQGVVNSIK